MNNQAVPRFNVLDSWRGIAACCIALVHFKIGVNSHIATSSFFEKAGLFVDFFFVLSGFVIFANYARRLSEGFGFWRFMLLRFGRLYPLHIFILLVFIGFELLQLAIPQLGTMAVYEPFSNEGESLSFIIASIFLVQSLGIWDDRIIAFNGPAWSISTEFYAYMLFALMLILFKRRIGWALIAVFCLSGLFLLQSGVYLMTTLKYGFIRCIFGFSAGALLWYAYPHLKRIFDRTLKNQNLWSAIEIGLIALLIAFLSLWAKGAVSMAAVLLFVVIVFVFANEKGVLSKILSFKFFLLLGALSYSIYMVHSFIAGKAVSLARFIAGNLNLDVVAVTNKGEHLLGANIWQGDLFTLCYMVLVILCSYITYKLIEEPGRKYFKTLVHENAFISAHLSRGRLGRSA